MFRWVRVFAALFYLGLLFSGAAWLANRYLVFDGLVAVAVGGRESLAVRPAGEGAGFTLSPHRGLSPDLLPFDNFNALNWESEAPVEGAASIAGGSRQ